jgi:hypothetical protein
VEGACNTTAEQAFCSTNNVREPLTTWTPTIGPAGLTYYDHPAIPDWRGSLLLVALRGSRLTQLPLDAAGNAIPSRTDFLTTFGRLRAICVSPQGRVYIGTSNRDGRGNPAATDDRILVLENRSFVATSTRSKASFSFDLYPNPTRRQATVRLPASNTLLTVRDLAGRTVLTQRTASTTATLDLAGLRAGSYLVQAEGPAGTATRQLVVE